MLDSARARSQESRVSLDRVQSVADHLAEDLAHDLVEGADIELLRDVGAVRLDRLGADLESAGNALAAFPAQDQLEDFALARGEHRKSLRQLSPTVALFSRLEIALERGVDPVEKLLAVERLLQEINGAGLHGANHHGHVPVRR